MFPMEAGTERMGETIQELTAFFYVYDGLVVLLRPEKFQRAFNVLADLSDWFSILINMRNMARMACRPCYTPGGLSDTEYMRRVTGVRPSYQ